MNIEESMLFDILNISLLIEGSHEKIKKLNLFNKNIYD